MADESPRTEPPEPLEPGEPKVTYAPEALEPPLPEEGGGAEAEPYFAPTDPVVSTRGPDIEVLGGFADTSMESIEVEPSAADEEPGDEALADAVRRELREDAETTDLDLSVDVRRGVARLRGSVPYPEDAELAVEVAGRVPGVREVVDLLEIAALRQ